MIFKCCPKIFLYIHTHKCVCVGIPQRTRQITLRKYFNNCQKRCIQIPKFFFFIKSSRNTGYAYTLFELCVSVCVCGTWPTYFLLIIFRVLLFDDVRPTQVIHKIVKGALLHNPHHTCVIISTMDPHTSSRTHHAKTCAWIHTHTYLIISNYKGIQRVPVFFFSCCLFEKKRVYYTRSLCSIYLYIYINRWLCT